MSISTISPTRAPGAIRPEALYSADETAAMLRISPHQLKRWARSPDGPPRRYLYQGSAARYLGADLIDALTRTVAPVDASDAEVAV